VCVQYTHASAVPTRPVLLPTVQGLGGSVDEGLSAAQHRG